MPKYHIITEVKARQVWEYIVDAESQEMAMSKVENGDVDAENYYVEDDSLNGVSAEPEIVEVNEI
jgi:hypothetical protein